MDTEQLVRRARQGDTKAFGTLYETHFLKVKGVCAHLLHDNGNAADDLAQDTFVVAFLTLSKLKDDTKFAQWVVGIATRLTYKHIERAHRLPAIPLSALSEDELGVPETSTATPQPSLQELSDIIGRLPSGYRKVFVLSVIEGKSHLEIAEQLGIAPHSSSSQLFRARTMLKRMLADYRQLALLLLLLTVVPVCKLLFNSKPARNEKGPTAKREKQPRQRQPSRKPMPQRQLTTTVPDRQWHTVAHIPAQTSTATPTQLDTIRYEEEPRIAQSAPADTVTRTLDTLRLPTPHPATDWAKSPTSTHRKWHLLAMGSLGPALAQNVYKMVTGNSMAPAPDAPSDDHPVVPEGITTWEGYNGYLVSNNNGTAPDTLALIEITANNSGDIVEHEHHDRPVTLGLSLTMPLGERWSIGSGVQYTLLRSTFVMGSENYGILRRQRIGYLGIPLRLSRTLVTGRRLSAYGSAGIQMDIPVYGRVRQQYVTNGHTAVSNSQSLHAPWQWSASAGLGLQYQLVPRLSVYIEPTLYYHLPTGSSIHTAWSEHPFTVTAPFGIRLSW